MESEEFNDETVLIDLISDMMHLAVQEGYDPEMILSAAKNHVSVELE